MRKHNKSWSQSTGEAVEQQKQQQQHSDNNNNNTHSHCTKRRKQQQTRAQSQRASQPASERARVRTGRAAAAAAAQRGPGCLPFCSQLYFFLCWPRALENVQAGRCCRESAHWRRGQAMGNRERHELDSWRLRLPNDLTLCLTFELELKNPHGWLSTSRRTHGVAAPNGSRAVLGPHNLSAKEVPHLFWATPTCLNGSSWTYL